MSQPGTSTVIVYMRAGDIVTPYAVQRAWQRGQFIETARWRVPFSQLRRETSDMPPGPLGYGRADLIAGGFVKPAGYSFDSLPCLRLHP